MPPAHFVEGTIPSPRVALRKLGMVCVHATFTRVGYSNEFKCSAALLYLSSVCILWHGVLLFFLVFFFSFFVREWI